MIVVVCPGQGAQTPGFLAPWLEWEGVRESLDVFSEAAEVDLVAAGTTWDADAIRDTRVAQPLIVAASIVAWSALPLHERVGGVAGHSVGEIAALRVASVLSSSEAMGLVGVRGRAMADAAAEHPTGMSAIIGGDEAAVLGRLADLGLTPANHNGAGQIVAAGEMAALAELAAAPVPATRVIPLQVAGAFHTDFMRPAIERLRQAADAIVPSDPDRLLWTNRDGSVVTRGPQALELLVGQVASPVRWDRCMASFADHGVTGIIELAPAGTLVGLAKRALKGVPTVAVKTPDDLDAAASLLAGESA